MPPKYLVVLGTSFCGSTLFARLASLIPNAASVGELHWVVDKDRRREPWKLPWTNLCRRCRDKDEACPVDWVSLRQGREQKLYERTREHFGAETLITTDKVPHFVSRLVRPSEVDVLVLWKSPQAARASFRRHWEPEDAWGEHYPKILDWAEAHARSVRSLQYEKLAADPVAAMAAVCDAYELPRIPARIDYSTLDCHIVGGNVEAHRRTEIAVDQRWRDELTEEERRETLEPVAAQAAIERLLQIAIR